MSFKYLVLVGFHHPEHLYVKKTASCDDCKFSYICTDCRALFGKPGRYV